ncbi:hypothetical protein LJ753_11070 [Arthrobacter sp. zg-Y20]|uniref:hypothetical protein n=1 Tax=unclassified Arthrobacter TaxID=235627 RepID=UPI001D1373AD|nr:MULTISPECIES: hypothetical protein [unclassified Arthrobacter]MCC3276411.1 hypothetical protein [Arthrobacter sp. zg-Y20]MDK1316570.1 hypothetical protein [Arthrobacter sp. zg.Y20]WIB06610.1 hypothetical protein QNO06_02370 [Arthrobacter sp. zg-Y20]
MDGWTGIIGALLGAGVGFVAVWWQHQAQSLERIRSKGAELVALGDRYSLGMYENPRRHAESQTTADLQRGRIDAMQAIARYLDISATPDLAFHANNFVAATAGLTGQVADEQGPEVAHDQFREARGAILKALKRKR